MSKKGLLLFLGIFLILLGILVYTRSRSNAGIASLPSSAQRQFVLSQKFLASLELLSKSYGINLWVQASVNGSSETFMLRSAPFPRFYVLISKERIEPPAIQGFKNCSLIPGSLVVYYNVSSFNCSEFKAEIEKSYSNYPGFVIDLILYPRSVQVINSCLEIYSKNYETHYTIISIVCDNYSSLKKESERLAKIYVKLLEENLSSTLELNGSSRYMNILYFAPTLKV